MRYIIPVEEESSCSIRCFLTAKPGVWVVGTDSGPVCWRSDGANRSASSAMSTHEVRRIKYCLCWNSYTAYYKGKLTYNLVINQLAIITWEARVDSWNQYQVIKLCWKVVVCFYRKNCIEYFVQSSILRNPQSNAWFLCCWDASDQTPGFSLALGLVVHGLSMSGHGKAEDIHHRLLAAWIKILLAEVLHLH